MQFRVRSRRPILFKTKLYVTINNSFQPLHIFHYKELHLSCFIGLKLSPTPQSSATLGKYVFLE